MLQIKRKTKVNIFLLIKWALIANYTYDLVKEFNSFYQQVSILGEENHDKKVFRVQLSKSVGNTIKNAFQLLGIEVPERM